MTLGAAGAARLREAFLAADYTADAVHDLLGRAAEAALRRGETVPARRATSGGSPVETLVRMFALQLAVPEAAGRAALPLDQAVEGGIVAVDGGEVRALLNIEPYAEEGGPPWWVASDLAGGLDGSRRPLPEDHVVGVGGASATLAQITVPGRVDRSLDIGTGSGVQALHASRRSREVVATDVSRRALAMAATTGLLSDVGVDLREGSFLEPVEGELFDLVVSNPPFVIGPAARYAYREGDLPLDGVTAHLVSEAPALLAPGGTLQLLGNWAHRRGERWEDRVASWLPATGFDVSVVQREVQDPAAYVALWLRDSDEEGAPGYVRRYDEWLGSLDAADVEAVGLGFVSLRRVDAEGSTTIVNWPHPVQQPLGSHVAADFERTAWLRGRDDDALSTSRLRLADDVVQEQVGRPGAEDPAYVVLRQQVGFRRAIRSDTATAAFAGACDGTLAVGSLVDAVLQVLELPTDGAEAARAALLAEVRGLVAAGMLTPT